MQRILGSYLDGLLARLYRSLTCASLTGLRPISIVDATTRGCLLREGLRPTKTILPRRVANSSEKAYSLLTPYCHYTWLAVPGGLRPTSTILPLYAARGLRPTNTVLILSVRDADCAGVFVAHRQAQFGGSGLGIRLV